MARFERNQVYAWSIKAQSEPEHRDDEGGRYDQPAPVKRRRTEDRVSLHGRQIDAGARPRLAEIGPDPPIESDFVYRPPPLPLNLCAWQPDCPSVSIGGPAIVRAWRGTAPSMACFSPVCGPPASTAVRFALYGPRSPRMFSSLSRQLRPRERASGRVCAADPKPHQVARSGMGQLPLSREECG